MALCCLSPRISTISKPVFSCTLNLFWPALTLLLLLLGDCRRLEMSSNVLSSGQTPPSLQRDKYLYLINDYTILSRQKKKYFSEPGAFNYLCYVIRFSIYYNATLNQQGSMQRNGTTFLMEFRF